MGNLLYARREMVAWMVALVLHGAFFFWKASAPLLKELGENPLINVDFIEEVQPAGLAMSPDTGKDEGFFAKLKNVFGMGKKDIVKKAAEADQLAGGADTRKIETKSTFDATIGQPSLKDKQDAFKSASFDIAKLSKKEQDLAASGEAAAAIGSAVNVQPEMPVQKLEDKHYSVAAQKLPFEVRKSPGGELAVAGDKVYVASGKKTSSEVRQLSSAVGGGGLAGTGSGSGGGGLIDKGASGGSIPGAGSGALGSRLASAPQGGGGSLAGAGAQGGGSSGSSQGGSGTGRSWGTAAGALGELSGGGSESGTGIAGGGSGKSGSGAGGSKIMFEISGQLAGRKILRKKIPPYPEWLAKEGIKTNVGLYFEVLSNGKVKTNIVVQKTSGDPRLDKLCSDTLLEWLFVELSAGEYGKIQWGVITFKFDIK